MIFPFQKVLPLEYPGESTDTLIETMPDLGVLNLRICKGLDYTSLHQMPIVRPVHEIPEAITAFCRIRTTATKDLSSKFAHFYMADNKFERVWNRPFKYLNLFRKMKGIISTDYSIYANMVEPQRIWNDFRNKLLAAFYQRHGVVVVPSPSWSYDLNNIERYMEGWPKHSVVSINSTGVCHDKRARKIWLDGYWAMMSILSPSHILRYGGFIEGEDKTVSTYYINNNRVGYGC